MKKYLFIAAAALLATSCTVTTKTARTETLPYAMFNASVADLEVAPQRISYTLVPSAVVRRAGALNCKKACISEALAANGNADLLIEPQFVIEQKKRLFSSKVSKVTVSGRPAKYKNFRSLNDSVWCNPTFRGIRQQYIIK